MPQLSELSIHLVVDLLMGGWVRDRWEWPLQEAHGQHRHSFPCPCVPAIQTPGGQTQWVHSILGTH